MQTLKRSTVTLLAYFTPLGALIKQSFVSGSPRNISVSADLRATRYQLMAILLAKLKWDELLKHQSWCSLGNE